jgi:hypothetical protein
VETACRSGDPDALRFTADDVLARVDDRGDLFAEAVSLKQKLPAV